MHHPEQAHGPVDCLVNEVLRIYVNTYIVLFLNLLHSEEADAYNTVPGQITIWSSIIDSLIYQDLNPNFSLRKRKPHKRELRKQQLYL